MQKRLYNINELAELLGFTVPAIHAQLARKNFEAVPPPIKLGRRLAWPVELLEEWLASKIAKANPHPSEGPTECPRRGRPRKTRTA